MPSLGLRRHIRLLSVLVVGLAGTGLLVVGFGLTPLSGSVLGSMFGLGPKSDFSMTSDSPTTVPRGQMGTISVTINGINHFSGSVSVTATLTTSANVPPLVASGQSSVSLTSGGTASFSVTVSATTSTTLGSYNIIVQGKTGMLSHSITVTAQVTPPPPPPTPYFYSNATSMTVTQGGSVNATLTVSSILSYSGTVALTASIYPSSVNSPTVSLNRTSLFLPAGGNNATIVTVNTFNATVGYYTISVSGISGSLSHTLDMSVSVNHFVGFEQLNLELSYFSSANNVTLYVRNTGSVTSSLVWYSVTDSSGDKYVLSGWNGPVINPNQLGIALVRIGASCPRCVLYGSAFTFTPGYSYTITLITRYGDLFTFTVVP